MTKKRNESGYSVDPSHPLYDPTMDPSHPSYDRDKADSEATSDSSDRDGYKVGPGFPPNEFKWKKGCPSPYPKGRPKKEPPRDPEVRKLFEDALNVKVQVTKADKKIMMTRLKMGFEQLAIQFAKGDRYARRDIFTYAAVLGVDLQPKQIIAEELGFNNQAIVDAFLRSKQQLSAEPSPENHVKAPADLLDDDVAKPDPNEDHATSPPPKKQDEPVRDEHGKPLGVDDIRHVRAMRERNIARQKKNQEES